MGGGDRGAGHVACVDHEEVHGVPEEVHGVPEEVHGVPEEVHEAPEEEHGHGAEEARGVPDLGVVRDRGRRVVVVDGLAFFLKRF